MNRALNRWKSEPSPVSGSKTRPEASRFLYSRAVVLGLVRGTRVVCMQVIVPVYVVYILSLPQSTCNRMRLWLRSRNREKWEPIGSNHAVASKRVQNPVRGVPFSIQPSSGVAFWAEQHGWSASGTGSGPSVVCMQALISLLGGVAHLARLNILGSL